MFCCSNYCVFIQTGVGTFLLLAHKHSDMVRSREPNEKMYGTDLEGEFAENPEMILSADLDELYGDDANLTDDDKRFITETAEHIKTLQNLSEGDTITFESSNRSAPVTATVETSYTGNWLKLTDEDGLPVEIIVDSEGATGSYIKVYVPYITVRQDQTNAGDITDLTVE